MKNDAESRNRKVFPPLLAVLVSVGPGACKRDAPPAPPAASAAPSASAPEGPPKARCAAPPQGAVATVGAEPPSAPSAEADDEVALPFSPEVGEAVALPSGGFAVGILEPGKDSVRALGLVLGPASSPKRVDLGAIHGDVLPPRISAWRGNVLAAVPTGAPSGSLVRLARIEDLSGNPRVRWGAEVQQGRDESDALSFSVGSSAAVLAWDEWDAAGGRSVVRAVTVDPADPTKVSTPFTLSGAGEDAEAPVVAARAGGFWVGWITNGKRVLDPEERLDGQSSVQPVDMGPRWVTVVALDPAGKPAGSTAAATPRAGHALGFDIASLPSGEVLVAWRDDATSPATAGGTVFIERLRADGTAEPRALAVEDLGPALPVLLVDDAPAKGAPFGWLTLAADNDAALLVEIDSSGAPLDEVAPEAALGTRVPLALSAGGVLTARPHGRGIDLAVLPCGKPQAARGFPNPR